MWYNITLNVKNNKTLNSLNFQPTLFSKCWVTTSFSPVYSLSPCLCSTIVYAFRYSSSKLSPELFFFCISCMAFFSSTQILSTYFSSMDICNKHVTWAWIQELFTNWPCIFCARAPGDSPPGATTAVRGHGGPPALLARWSCD